MITVVVVYNNANLLNELKLSLYKQTSSFELIPINNTAAAFPSAATALNWGGTQAKSDYIMFVHQDVEFCEKFFLEDAENFLKKDETIGVAGVAGLTSSGKNFKERCKNTIYHGYPNKRLWGNPIKEPEDVQTLDECVLIIPRSNFKLLKFDEQTCSDWHHYGVDYCLASALQGFRVVALPLCIYHKSSGSSAHPKWKFFGFRSKNSNFYHSLKKILKKYNGKVHVIATTCGVWRSDTPLWWQRIITSIKVRLGVY